MVEDSQNDWFTSTQRETDGSYSAEVDGRATDATLTLANSVDLSPYGSARCSPKPAGGFSATTPNPAKTAGISNCWTIPANPPVFMSGRAKIP